MSVAFTACVDDPTAIVYWTEMYQAVEERYAMTAITKPSHIIGPQVGDRVRAYHCSNLQAAIEALVPYFAASDTTPGSMTAASFWSQMGQTYWRAVDTVEGGIPQFEYRIPLPGDIIGPWLIDDIQRGLSILKWRWLPYTSRYRIKKDDMPAIGRATKDEQLAFARSQWVRLRANEAFDLGYVLYQSWSLQFGLWFLRSWYQCVRYLWARPYKAEASSLVLSTGVYGKGTDPAGDAGINAASWTQVLHDTNPDGSVQTRLIGNLTYPFPADVLPSQKYDSFSYGSDWDFKLLLKFNPTYSN